MQEWKSMLHESSLIFNQQLWIIFTETARKQCFSVVDIVGLISSALKTEDVINKLAVEPKFSAVSLENKIYGNMIRKLKRWVLTNTTCHGLLG